MIKVQQQILWRVKLRGPWIQPNIIWQQIYKNQEVILEPNVLLWVNTFVFTFCDTVLN